MDIEIAQMIIWALFNIVMFAFVFLLGSLQLKQKSVHAEVDAYKNGYSKGYKDATSDKLNLKILLNDVDVTDHYIKIENLDKKEDDNDKQRSC